jgi:cytochrome c biogenesis protein CcdA
VEILALALASGLIAALNPCGFAMLPAYLTLVVLGDDRTSRSKAVGRALGATAAMALGFLVVFGGFGLVIAPIARSAQRYLPAVTVVIGLGLVVLGVLMLLGREFTLLLPKSGKGAPTKRLGSMFGYGIAYAVASLSCTIGPFLAITMVTFRHDSVMNGVLAYLVYGLGMALSVAVLAVAIAVVGHSVHARAVLPYVNRVGGGLLVVVGLYVGYYGVYELDLYFGDGDAADPVIESAAAVQEALAGLVSAIGPLPLLGVLVLLVTGGVLFGTKAPKAP